MKTTRAVTLPEAMILILILALVAVAAGTGLQAVVSTPAANDKVLAINNSLMSKMEEIHTLSFANLPPGNTLSDTVTLSGVATPRTVLISLYDADGDGTPDPDCKEITITIGVQTISCVTVQP